MLSMGGLKIEVERDLYKEGRLLLKNAAERNKCLNKYEAKNEFLPEFSDFLECQ